MHVRRNAVPLFVDSDEANTFVKETRDENGNFVWRAIFDT